jgi:retrograde regulation protein 2
MMAAIEVATNGLHVQILEPAVETLLGAVMGSRSGLADVQGGALFLDLGGGSVQMTWVDTAVEGYEIHAAKAGNSLPFGAAKLKRILDNLTGETQLLELGKLSVGMQDSYKRLCATFPALDAIRTAYENGDTSSLVNVYMCGGGFRGYGSMLMHDDPIKPYPIPSINSYTVDGDRFKQIARMRQINQEYEGKIPGLSTRRRSQFPAIAAVIETFTQTVPNIGRVTFCGGSNREGLLMMKLPKQIREDHPLHVLGPANAGDMLLCKAVLQKLSTALPQGLDLSRMPTILSTGLGPLWAGELWSRQGYDANTNASFALHNALIRDSDCPGLSHLTRALLAVTSVARWGCNPAPVDSDLYKGLRRVADSHTPNASFWALYIGVVSGILTTILPTAPVDVQQLDTAIRYDSIPYK